MNSQLTTTLENIQERHNEEKELLLVQISVIRSECDELGVENSALAAVLLNDTKQSLNKYCSLPSLSSTSFPSYSSSSFPSSSYHSNVLNNSDSNVNTNLNNSLNNSFNINSNSYSHSNHGIYGDEGRGMEYQTPRSHTFSDAHMNTKISTNISTNSNTNRSTSTNMTTNIGVTRRLLGKEIKVSAAIKSLLELQEIVEIATHNSKPQYELEQR